MSEVESTVKGSQSERRINNTDPFRRQRRSRAKKMRAYYLLMIVPIVILFIFHYVPIYGVIIAFKDFRYIDGIIGSPWNNFRWFKHLFTDPFFLRILRNTIIISLYRIIFGFPAPIILALLLNEVRMVPFKKVVQTVSYFPHFVSWVVLGSILIEVLSPSRGPIGSAFVFLGLKPISWLTNVGTFRGLLVVTGIWQGIGWGSIVYLAVLSSVDPDLYEVAAIEGAGRFQKIIFINIPALVPVMTILVILRMGSILSVGFQQIFILYNPLVYEVADVIDTYVYRMGILRGEYSFSTAVGLFKNVVGFLMVVLANSVAKRVSEYAIW